MQKRLTRFLAGALAALILFQTTPVHAGFTVGVGGGMHWVRGPQANGTQGFFGQFEVGGSSKKGFFGAHLQIYPITGATGSTNLINWGIVLRPYLGPFFFDIRIDLIGLMLMVLLGQTRSTTSANIFEYMNLGIGAGLRIPFGKIALLPFVGFDAFNYPFFSSTGSVQRYTGWNTGLKTTIEF
jgi:hypothetical protein